MSKGGKTGGAAIVDRNGGLFQGGRQVSNLSGVTPSSAKQWRFPYLLIVL